MDAPPKGSGPSASRERLRRGLDLTETEAAGLAADLVEGRAGPAEARELLEALARKGETEEELLGFAREMRRRATPFPGPREARAIDLCGTGGAPQPSFNISTVSAFVVAAAGLPVAKHGNASARGPCGSSDLLEALGLPVKTSRSFARRTWEREGLAFLHAPLYHPAMRSVAPVRRAIGTRTIFNQLGPLTNPAGVRAQLVGCFSEAYGRKAVRVLGRLGVEDVGAVHSRGAHDEVSSQQPTWLLHAVRSAAGAPGTTAGPEGVPPASDEREVLPEDHLAPEERRGSLEPRPPAEAALLARAVLRGEGDGAVRGAVLLTSGLALWCGGHVRDLAAGVKLARGTLDRGEAATKLRAVEEITRSSTWADGP